MKVPWPWGFDCMHSFFKCLAVDTELFKTFLDPEGHQNVSVHCVTINIFFEIFTEMPFIAFAITTLALT